MIKKVIFVAHENDGSRELFTKLYEDHKKDIDFQVIITTGLYYRKSLIASIWKMLTKASFWFCFHRFLDLLQYKSKFDTLEKRAKKWNVPVYFSNDINDETTTAYIKSLQPDLMFSTYTMHILKNHVINIPKHGTIGCHLGLLPNQRGLETFFWVIANEEKETGVSVFYITEKIDKGKLIMEERFDIPADETVTSIYKKETEMTGAMLSKTLSKLKNNESFESISIPEGRKEKYHGMPTREAYRKYKKLGKKWK
jgi:folate-dependent phosphoribosylglycinamide formyltransferase PurN